MQVLERIWWDYPWAVDFLLYFFFFGALVRAALTRHFGDDLAKRLAIAMGLVLAVGLAVAQRRLGFALEDVGPAAVVLIVLALGLVAYGLLRHAEVPVPYALIFALLFVVVSFRAMELDIWRDELRLHPDWIAFGWILGALLAWHGIASSQHIRLDRQNSLRRLPAGPWRKQRDAVKEDVRRRKRIEYPQSRTLEKAIDQTNESIKSRPGEVSESALRERIRLLEETASRLASDLSRLRRFDRALQRTDWEWLAANRKLSRKALDRMDARRFRSEIALERSKMNLEERMAALSKDAESHTLETRELLRLADEALSNGKRSNVSDILNSARGAQARAVKITKSILSTERKLEWILRKQVSSRN